MKTSFVLTSPLCQVRTLTLALSLALTAPLGWASSLETTPGSHTTLAPMTILEARDRLLQVDLKLVAAQHQVDKAAADREAAQSLDGPKIDLTFKEVLGTKTLDMNVDTGASARLAQLEAMARPTLTHAMGQAVQNGALPANAVPGLMAVGNSAHQIASQVAQQLNTLHFHDKVSLNGPRLVLEVNWPLYTGGLITAQQHQLESLVRVMQAKAQQTHLEEEAQLIVLYYGVQLLREQVRIRESLEADAQALMDKAQRMFEVGTLSRVEALGAKVAYENAKTDTDNARVALSVQTHKLEALLDLDTLPELASPLMAVPLPQESEEALVAQSQSHHPVLEEVQAQGGRADAGIEAAKAQFLPKVGLFAQKNLIKRYLSINEPDWVAGLGVTMTLWSDQDRRAQLRSAQAQRDTVDTLERQARRELRQAVTTAYSTMLESYRQLERLPTTVALAHENLTLKTQQFKVGLATLDDVNAARTQWAAAQLAEKAAMYQYLGARVQLAVATGNTDSLFAQLTPRTRGNLPVGASL